MKIVTMNRREELLQAGNLSDTEGEILLIIALESIVKQDIHD